MLPVTNQLISATILHDECMYADAYATACMSFGLDSAKKHQNSFLLDIDLLYLEEELYSLQ